MKYHFPYFPVFSEGLLKKTWVVTGGPVYESRDHFGGGVVLSLGGWSQGKKVLVLINLMNSESYGT